MIETLAGTNRRQGGLRRSYPTVEGPAEPVALFGRLACEGIRLRRSGVLLHAEVPGHATEARWWLAVDRLLERHAASLAVTLNLARAFAERHPPERVAALLAELREDLPEILLETVGGRDRLAALIAAPPTGADLDLACVACCRGLAIRAIRDGSSLAGLLTNGNCDGEEQGRGYRTAEASGDWPGGGRWPTEQRERDSE